MGISVQDAGIAVEKGRYYLVNLNADPSLNEMLVYYLKVSLFTSAPTLIYYNHSQTSFFYTTGNC